MTPDEAALFDEAVTPFLRDGVRLARWLLGDHVEADDVVQDAALRALKGLGGYRGGGRAWFLTIVRNTAATHAKKKRSRPVADDDAELALAQTPSGDPSPEAALIARADRAALQKALTTLPDAYREIIILREIGGLSYREIGEAVGAPVGTVMSRLARGREALARAVADKDPRRKKAAHKKGAGKDETGADKTSEGETNKDETGADGAGADRTGKDGAA